MKAGAISRWLACVAVVAVDSLELRRVDPALDPPTAKEHEKDLPHDAQPEVPKGWRFDHLGGHPYPVVATASDFDRDYVRDENGDGGEWNAQMAYDTLRARVVKEKMDVELAAKKMAEEKKELDAKKKEEEAAEQKSKKAEATAAAAKLAEDEADRRVEKLTGKDDGENQTVVGGQMADATSDVEKQMADLEKCKEQLAAAKKQLKDLIDAQASKDQAAVAAANGSNFSINKDGKSEDDMTLEEKVAKARMEHAAAKANLEKQEQDVKDTLAAIEESKKKLKAARAASKNPVKAKEDKPASHDDHELSRRSGAAVTAAFGLATVVVTAALALA